MECAVHVAGLHCARVEIYIENSRKFSTEVTNYHDGCLGINSRVSGYRPVDAYCKCDNDP
jgi:hypothetical protein